MIARVEKNPPVSPFYERGNAGDWVYRLFLFWIAVGNRSYKQGKNNVGGVSNADRFSIDSRE